MSKLLVDSNVSKLLVDSLVFFTVVSIKLVVSENIFFSVDN